MMRKKIVSLCMALALCLGLLPVTALAVEGAPNSLYVGDQQVIKGDNPTFWTTDESTGGLTEYEGNDDNWNVKYDPNTATLTLNGATINGALDATSPPYGSGIYALCSSKQPVALTIELIGKNTITGNYGIYVDAQQGGIVGTDASLLIQNSSDYGILKVSGSSHGIYVKSGTGNASLTIKDASVVASCRSSYGGGYDGVCVHSGSDATSSPKLSLAVDGGSLTTIASEGNDGIQFYVGAHGVTSETTSLSVTNNAIVDARNGGISARGVSSNPNVDIGSTDSTGGIVFDGTEGTVYGNVTLDEGLTINQGETLTVPEGSSLNANGKLTNDGTINVESGGNLTGKPEGGTVVHAPTITAQPADMTVTVGQTASFTVTATGENLSYQWQQITDNGQSWTDIDGATDATYTEEATTTIMNGYQYRCVVSNSAGSVTSEVATLTVNEPVPTTYTITADVDPVEAGTVTVNGSGTSASVAAGSPVTLNAAANEGYRFTGWMENDQQVSTNATYTFNANGDRTLTAKFEKKVTGVTLNTETLELFTGGSATLTATVEPSDAANQNVTWQSDSADVATVQNGTVTAVAPGSATITATTVDGGFTAACTVTVRPDIPPANPNYRITLEATQGGTVTADPTAAKAGTTVTLTPVPHRGYQVGSVAVTDRFGDAVAVTEQADGTYTFTMPNGQVSVEVTFVEAAPEPLPFTDVAETDWFHDAVQYAYENGLMDGVGDGQFAPNATTNRAMVVTILYRLAGEPAVSGDAAFTDVADGLWYTDAVLWAAQKGIVNGISETEFAPGGDLTREQLATVLYRYAQDQGYDVSASADLSGYPDAGQVQDYAQPAMAWAVAEGIVEGMDGNLNPAGNATRAQIATILMRFLAAVSAE